MLELIAGLILFIPALVVGVVAFMLCVILTPVFWVLHFAIQDTLHGSFVVGALILGGCALALMKK